MRLTGLTLLAPLCTIPAACQQASGAGARVLLEIVVEADPGVRLRDIPIRVGEEQRGSTGADGTLQVQVTGVPGRVLQVAHECPAGHRPSPKGASIRMRRYHSDEAPRIQVDLACRPIVRIAAFVVRAKNGPYLPVSVNGEPVATTNSSGVAHFSKSGHAGAEYLVEIDASGDPMLVPRFATKIVRLPDANELFVITPSFHSADPVKKPRRGRRRIIKIE